MSLRSFKNDVEKVVKQIESEDNNNYTSPDDRWKPEVIGNSQTKYKVRLLPRMETETGQPWFEKRMHYIDLDNNEQIVEPCPTTIDEDCPFCEESQRLFNTGNPFDEEKALNLWRKKRYVANILVREDEREGGENEGGVFIWEFGTTIYDLMKNAISDDHLIFWDPFEGADLRIAVQKKQNYTNYDGSSFDRQNSPIAEDKSKAEEIVDKCYNLTEKFNEDAFKSYEELKEIMEEKMVLTEESDEDVIETSTDLSDQSEEMIDEEEIEDETDWVEDQIENDSDDSEPDDDADVELDDEFEDDLDKELDELDLDDI